ncbi:MAG: HDOD domain-containing protein [Candidatus Abyssobacteria bacterium SURF_17]|uniref:HDOD domain-containing protein n=1 Tax=Candidatus Abyssobacteria bacterium SURF_17 TaxID=2093361 RepID=A0A419EZD2_9BACT|nr:MAG: HDOD domain-containing protein [Candidatus Abyssubacteria bacterium SURF_17]
MKRMIGELLVEGGYVTVQQVEYALEVQKKKKKRDRICNILMDLGYLTEEAFLEFLTSMPGMASVELARCEIPSEVLGLVPKELALQLEIVPIGRLRNLLTVAMVCPIDKAGREKLEAVTGLKIKPVLCPRRAVYRALDRYYREPQEIGAGSPVETVMSALDVSLKLQRVARLVQEIEELPTLPAIVSTISAIVNDPKSSSADLAKVISADGALSSKILRLANSPAFGFSRKISDIKHAITLLGFKETQALAMSVAVFDRLSVGQTQFDFKAYWNHSFSCATLSRLLSANLDDHAMETAFVAGLLHDVGKVVLAMSLRDRKIQLASADSETRIEAEEKTIGINHAEIGYLLADHWLLPSPLANAIRYHHVPEVELGPKGLSRVVFLADIFSKINTAELSEDMNSNKRVDNILKELNISEGALRKALDGYGEIAADIVVF